MSYLMPCSDNQDSDLYAITHVSVLLFLFGTVAELRYGSRTEVRRLNSCRTFAMPKSITAFETGLRCDYLSH